MDGLLSILSFAAFMITICLVVSFFNISKATQKSAKELEMIRRHLRNDPPEEEKPKLVRAGG